VIGLNERGVSLGSWGYCCGVWAAIVTAATHTADNAGRRYFFINIIFVVSWLRG
jgi:hypothetical protein